MTLDFSKIYQKKNQVSLYSEEGSVIETKGWFIELV